MCPQFRPITAPAMRFSEDPAFRRYCRRLGFTSPPTERGRQTCARILDAVERRLMNSSFAALRIEDVLEDAQTTAGSFYHRFDSRDALRPALLERYLDDLSVFLAKCRAARTGWSHLDCHARGDRIIRDRVKRFTARRGLLRSMVIEQRDDPSSVQKILVRAAGTVIDAVVDVMLPTIKQGSRQDRTRRLHRWYYVTGALCRELILFPELGRAPLDMSGDPLSLILDTSRRLLLPDSPSG